MDDDFIVVRLGDDNASGEVSVSVNGVRATRSTIDGAPAFCAIPQVRALSPTGGHTGESVHLRGSNFDPDAQVFVGSAITPQPAIVHRGPNHIEMIIQTADGNGNLRVQNRCGNTDTGDAEFRHIPFGIYLPLVLR